MRAQSPRNTGATIGAELVRVPLSVAYSALVLA